MSNVIVKSNRYTVEPLYQWDKNQVLTIYGLSLASIPEIHFTNTGMDRAIVRQATMDDAGIISADVPNSLLQKPYTITAYVCIYEGDTFKSLYTIDIPVKARKKPGDYTIENTDGEIYSFNAIENKVENFIRNITDQTETFKNDMSNKFSDTEKKVNTALENIDQYKTDTDISIDQYKKDIDERVSSSENIVNGYDDRLSLAETDIIGIREAIGDEWNETTTYNAGDLKIYNNILWECLVDNVGQTPEEGTYWTKRQITDLFSQLNSKLQMGTTGPVSVPAGSTQDISVTLDKPFVSSPHVMVSLLGGSSNTKYLGVAIMDSTLTNTGFTIRLTNAGSNAYSIMVNWIAISKD